MLFGAVYYRVPRSAVEFAQESEVFARLMKCDRCGTPLNVDSWFSVDSRMTVCQACVFKAILSQDGKA